MEAELTVQASISVILVLLYGYLARAYGLLSEQGESVSLTALLPVPERGRELTGAEHVKDLGDPVLARLAVLGDRSPCELGEPAAMYVSLHSVSRGGRHIVAA